MKTPTLATLTTADHHVRHMELTSLIVDGRGGMLPITVEAHFTDRTFVTVRLSRERAELLWRRLGAVLGKGDR